LLGIIWCYRRADLVIANAPRVAEDIYAATHIPWKKIRVLDNPTVTSEIFKLAALPTGHPWLDNIGLPVILGVGRLVRQKDFKTLISAFDKVRKMRNCRLVILGEGKEREKLKRQITELGLEESVDLPGFAQNPFAFMARAAVFVLSSAWEGSPNVLIEALALGIPSVSTDCPGGSREILADGHFGPLVPTGSVEKLADGILQCLENPISADQLRHAVERFHSDRCAIAYLHAMGL